MAGLHATIGILAALHARDQNGRGQHVEVNLLASAMSGMVNQTSAYVAGGVTPQRMGNSHPSLFPYEPLQCADGELIITAGNNGQFRKLVEVLGVPGLADDPRFARNEDRTVNRDELRRPLLVERLIDPDRVAGSARSSTPGCPADRSTMSAVESRSPRSSVSTRSSRSARATRWCRRSGTRSLLRDPRRLSTAAAGARRARRRHPSVAEGIAMSERGFPTSLGTSTAEEISLLGQSLADDLMGKVGFGELAFWLVALRRPTPGETRVFEAVLVALADHGFTPTAIAARLTYLSAPDSLQGAMAAGLLGGGSRFLGVKRRLRQLPARRARGEA